MYGGFLKTQEPEISKPPLDPEPVVTAPPTAKKKGPGFGRSNGKVMPLRADAVPELSQVYSEVYSDLAKSNRRSHGNFFNQNESHEWAYHTNNTIPETLNSSREWNFPHRANFSSSQNDLRAISESTPLKSAQQDHHDRASATVDKENFYTPRKTSEAFAASTPSARCPLSALPMDSAAAKDTIDGVLSHKSSDLQTSSGGTGFFESTKKISSDADIFRTPQCKIAPNHQTSIHASGHTRPRLYGLSSSKVLTNIPLHPAVAAGQQHAKHLQHQQVAEKQFSQESRISRKLIDPTPSITPAAPVMKQSQVATVLATTENQPSHLDGVSQSSNSWIRHSRPVEVTPFKSVPNLMSAPLKQVDAASAARLCEKQPPTSSMAAEDSVSSTWVPHNIPSCATYSRAPHVQNMDGASRRPGPETKSHISEPPLSKIKLEAQDTVEAVIEPKKDKQQQLSPAQVGEMKPLQCAPKLLETATVDSGVPRIVINPPGADARSPPQPSTHSAQVLAKKTDTLQQVVQGPVREAECPPQPPAATKNMEPFVGKVTMPMESVKTMDSVKKVQGPVRESECPPQPPAATKSMEPPVAKVAMPMESMKTVDSVKKTSSGCGEIVVNGRSYSILSLLGRGGSSKVYQVLDPANSQLKAVKCVNLADTDVSICEGYLNEIKLLAELQDGESVIRMFDHEHKKDQNLLLVVMEKGDTDLSKLIKEVSKSKKISAAMIVYYWTEMLNAVSFIHKRGTIHSDLKPANFLLVSGRLKLIDFGIASSVQEDMTSVMKESLTGTYNYISPEALSASNTDGQGYKISYKSDVWSLGCILYSLVYGQTPFHHITGQFQKLNAIVSTNYKIQFPEPPVEGCPSAIIQAMKSCLTRNPKERASVDELLQLHYLERAGPERVILSQFANLAASVGLVQETEDNRYAVVIRAMQRLIIENEKHLPFLGRKR